MLPIHVVAGLLAIAAGAIALYVAKGSPMHRGSGQVFVVAMLVMAASGALMATSRSDPGTALGGVLVFYVVCTGMLTVRRAVDASRGWLIALMLLALAAGITEFAFGRIAAQSPGGKFAGYPSTLYFVFATIALLCVTGDARMLSAGRIEGAQRLVRHIWRMSFAMFMATASFFLGQAKVFPEPLRHMFGVRAIPVVLVLIAMIYWLVRVKFKAQRGAPLLQTAR